MVAVRMGHLRKLAPRNDGLFIHRVRARHVERHRIKRGKHTDIRHDGNIVFRMAVAVRRHIHNEADMEIRSAGKHRLRVFGNLAIQDIVALILRRHDRILRANADTTAAAHTFIMVNRGLSVYDGRAVVRAHFRAASAADTTLLHNIRLARAVHFHFSGTGAAAHAHVFEGAAEARALMSLEMVQRDDDVRVHDRPADFCFLHVLAAFNRHEHIVRAFQPVGDDDMTVRGKRRKAVLISGIEMVERVFPAAHIQRIAIRQKRLAAEFLDDPHDHGRVVGT